MILESMSLLTMMLVIPPLVITAMDFKFAATWLKLEVTVAVALVTGIWLYTMFRKWFNKKQLDGSTVLITNGQSALSKELAAQLSTLHRCRVILLTNQQMAAPVFSSLHREYSCNVLNSCDLRELVGKIQTELSSTRSGIDILIENGISSESVVDSCDVKQFIERTSHSIMSTINLLMNFIPVLAQSQSGHYVTIQPTIRAAQPFLEAKSEVSQLINHLQTRLDSCNDSSSSVPPQLEALAFRPPLKLSTIVLQNTHLIAAGHSPSDLSVAEVAQQVIAGIRTESRMLSVNAKRSRIEYSWRKVRRFFVGNAVNK